MMTNEPTVTIHGEVIEQGFLLMVESAAMHGVVFAVDGTVLAGRERANPDALEMFERQPYSVALSLAWLAEHARMPRPRADCEGQQR